MAFWTDNMSNISDEELLKDDLRLDSILVKEVTVSDDLFDRGNVTSEAVSEAVDLSQLSKRMPWNIEESQAVDLTSKARCPTSLKDVTLENSQKETKLLDILRLASRPTQGQDLLCHLCDLEVGSMRDLQAHFETEHSDCLPKKIPCTGKEDTFGLEEIGVVAKNYGAVAKPHSGGFGNKKMYAERRSKKFPCIVCKKKFFLKIDMKNHVRKVHLAKVVPCGLCAKQVKEVDMSKHTAKYHS